MVKKRRSLLRRWATQLLGAVFITVLLCGFPVSALAFTYTDTENLVRLDIPDDNDAVYYYTPDQTNLFEDLLEQVQNASRDIRILVRTYTDEDVLGYSLEVALLPLPGTAPSVGDAPANSIYRDIRSGGDEERSSIEATVRSVFEGRFNMSAARDTDLQGMPAIEMDGTGVDGTGWAPYDCSVYLLSTDQNLLMISFIFDSVPSNEYRTSGLALLNSMAIGPNALSEPGAVVSEQPTAEPAVQTTPLPATQAPQETESGTLWTSILEYWQANTRLVYLLLAAVAGLIVVGWIIGHRKSRELEEEAKAKRVAHAEVFAEMASQGKPVKKQETTPKAGHPRKLNAQPEVNQDTKKVPTRQEPTKQLPPVQDSRHVKAKAAEAIHQQTSSARSNQRAEVEEAEAEAIYQARSSAAADSQRASAHDVRGSEKPIPGQLEEEVYAPESANNRRKEESGEEDQDSMIGDEQRQFRGKDFDYAEDISRYTQQPGPEVNDVSRFTHGYTNEPNELDSLRDMPYSTQNAKPSVGSRVARNRSRKKRGK